MSKRFTDTDKWKKHSFRYLEPKMKLLWMYILDDCDITGLWHQDLEIASVRVGETITEEEAIEALEDKIVVLDGGNKWFIKDFMPFQYGSEMSQKNNIYKSIKKILDKYDLYPHLNIEIVGEGTNKSSKRGRLSKKMKEAVLLDDELTCQYCQEQKPIAELVVDHIVPLERGGDNEDYNLITACVRCNSHKTDIEPQDFITRDHDFLSITEKVLKRVRGACKKLKAPYNLLEGGKEKEQEQEQYKVKEKRKEPKNEKKYDPKHKPDSIEDVVAFFENNGLGESAAEDFYYHFDAQQWVRGNGMAVGSWQSLAMKWIRDEKFNKPDWKGGEEKEFNPKIAVMYQRGLS